MGWRRRLLAWEEDLVGKCTSLLSNVTLQDNITDVGDGYTVRGVYQMLIRQEMHNRDELVDPVWHKHVPLKVSICVWHLLQNRWPTKDNLVHRGIIPVEAQLCVSGCGNNEMVDHLLIHCLIFGMLWQHVKNWIGLTSVEPQHVLDHFTQFAYATRSFKPCPSFLQLV